MLYNLLITFDLNYLKNVRYQLSLLDVVISLSFSHSEPNIATAFGRRSRRKIIAEPRTASSRLFIIPVFWIYKSMPS